MQQECALASCADYREGAGGDWRALEGTGGSWRGLDARKKQINMKQVREEGTRARYKESEGEYLPTLYLNCRFGRRKSLVGGLIFASIASAISVAIPTDRGNIG